MKKTNNDKSISIQKILFKYNNKLESVMTYHSKFGQIAMTEDSESITKFTEYLKESFKEVGIDLKDDSNKKKAKLSPEKFNKLSQRLRNQPKLSVQNYDILSSSSFLILNNYFEYLLADLLSYFYVSFKKSLSEKEFKVSLQELNEHETIAELESTLIYKEVETMLVELSFPALLEHFKEKLSISLSDTIINWSKLLEFRERRHLIVHNSSIVNKKYISRTDNPYKLKQGDKVQVSDEYFKESYNEYRLAGLILSLNCWAKWEKDTVDSAIATIMIETFEALKKGEFEYVIRLTDYASKIEARNENQSNFLLRTAFNRCIALKRLGNKDALSQELKKIKIGTSTPIFKLAHAILSDSDEKEIFELLKQAFSIDEISEDYYQDWPIFSFIRVNPKLDMKVRNLLKTHSTKSILQKKNVKTLIKKKKS